MRTARGGGEWDNGGGDGENGNRVVVIAVMAETMVVVMGTMAVKAH